MKAFQEIKGKLGFGTLRLPQAKDKQVDLPLLSRMVDCYMENGFNYFDVAFAYMGGKCEESIRESLVKRYPRKSFVMTDKLTYVFFNKEEDIRPFFQRQLENAGVEYFDFYLMHALTRKRYEKFKKCHAFEVAKALQAEGKIRHLGISFHDKADFLEELLMEHPEIEVVQIQFNYADYESPAIESRKVYEVCRKFHKPMFVMEPVKGGSLQRLPPDAREVFDKLNEKYGTRHSYASYALRFVAGFEGIEVILSGMNAMEQMEENVKFMKAITPLNEEERHAIEQVREIFNSKQMIQCTACRYCTDECPKHILIPDMFACFNQKKIFNHWNQDYYYNNVLTVNNPKASACLKCGKCELACPQHLPIRELLVEVANEFEPHIDDMKPEEKGYQEALWTVSNRICFLGKGNKFNPEGHVRKLDIAVYLWRLAGRPVYEGKDFDIKDIPSDFRFRDAIYWGLSKRIFYLDKEGKFNHGKHCKRLDVIAYLHRWAGEPDVSREELNVSDYKEGSFTKAVLWALEKGIMSLDKERKLYPLVLIDRKTVVQCLFKIKLHKKEDGSV